MIGLRFNLIADRFFWVKEQIKYKKMAIIKEESNQLLFVYNTNVMLMVGLSFKLFTDEFFKS